jgi:hypothetical protein
MNPTAPDLVEEAAAWALGGGVLTCALFPFALPILLLTMAFVLPFALAGLAIALALAVVAAPILLVRRFARRWIGAPPARPATPQSPPDPTKTRDSVSRGA